MLGVALLAIVVVGVAIAISSGAPAAPPKIGSTQQKAIAAKVQTLLAGIPQAGNRIGSPAARVTVTEYGDLECPYCAQFATGAEQQLIAGDVRAGRVALVYRSLCTATCHYDQSIFPVQQAAAVAAGLQGHEWDYIELFYSEQGAEGTGYVTDSYLNNLAAQIPGLSYSKWLSDRSSQALAAQVTADEQQASANGFSSTPTILVQGPKGKAVVGSLDHGALESAIKKVS